MKLLFRTFFSSMLLIACQQTQLREPSPNTLFEQIDCIQFINQVKSTGDLDVFRYRNFFNGGGVSIGDINNDGLSDIYLTSNLDSNRLFLNKGSFQFEDITRKSGVWGMKAWSTGTSMVDVNGDGLLDIYVCNAGNANGDNRENELFINQGDLTFKEQSKTYGLADPGWSTHAAFFDMDKDGDLDCYVLNNSFRSVNSFGLENIRHTRHPYGGDRLYRNDDDQFVDVSEEAGIYGSEIAFGLGIAMSDFNNDGWTDLYISNDFFERDYLYINDQDGTFTESLEEYFNHTSEFSMGTDAADINNDGYTDLLITDMLPETDYRLKTSTSFMTYDVQEARRRNDYYHQYMKNSLQLNNGNGSFSEIGHYSGISATDWSWGALIADFDNSGHKEIFVATGIPRDVIDQDFINYFAQGEALPKILKGEKVNYSELVESMPQTPLPNYLFKKTAETLQFKNIASDWSLDSPGFSNGSAYGDLDNDGDLDLVVNNLNENVSVYRNNSPHDQHHYLRLIIQGTDKNKFGIGAKVTAINNGEIIYYEHYPMKGFQSSMDYVAHLGLGNWDKIDQLKVEWPDGYVQEISGVNTDTTLTLSYLNAQTSVQETSVTNTIFQPLQDPSSFEHSENPYVDFDYDRLLVHMNSREGPAFASADLNGDQLDDFYVGGAFGSTGEIYIQKKNGKFQILPQSSFKTDAVFEDTDAIFIDGDLDGDLDLYVVSGGSELTRGFSFQDRYYENTGSYTNPIYQRRPQSLPNYQYSGSCVVPFDYDQDGDLDLFVGTRLEVGKYGLASTSVLLKNDLDKFVDVTTEKIPQLKSIGMVTDATWTDYDQDGLTDLIIAGHYMPITVFKNRGAGFQKMKEIPGLVNSSGLWNSIEAIDVNGDGIEDLLAGNLGTNSRIKASAEKPFYLYINDFDGNGSLDHIYAHHVDEKIVPFTLKHELIKQLPHLKKKYVHFKDYANQSVNDVFGPDLIARSIQLQVETLHSQVFINSGSASFQPQKLPEEVQYSAINAFSEIQLRTGEKIILTAGNLTAVQPQMGRYDASFGTTLSWDGDRFITIPNRISGLKVRGVVQNVATIKTGTAPLVAFIRNNESIAFYSMNDD